MGKEHAGHFEEKFAKNLANMLVGRLIGKFDVATFDDAEGLVEDKGPAEAGDVEHLAA